MPNHVKNMQNAVTAMLGGLPMGKQPSQDGLPDPKARDVESKKKREAYNDSVCSATKKFLRTQGGRQHPQFKKLKEAVSRYERAKESAANSAEIGVDL